MFSVIPDFLTSSAKKYPNKTALIFEGRRYSYLEAYEKSIHIASYILKNTKEKEIIGLLLSNTEDFIFAYFGILMSGRSVLLLPVNISDDSFRYQINTINTKLIISEVPYIKKIERVFSKGVLYKTPQEIFNKKVNRLNFPKISEGDISTIIFTSGTSSVAKGVKLRHRNVVSATKNIIKYLKFNKNDIDVNISSLSHSFGLGHIHCIFAVGGTVILFRNSIQIGKILDAILYNKATTFGVVPAILNILIEHNRDKLKKCGRYLRLIQTNTSFLSSKLINGILTIIPSTHFCYYYGLTEASRSTFITFNSESDKITSVGKALSNVFLKIVDSNGRKMPNGKMGEICIKGKHVVQEYWDSSITSQRIVNGWLQTGDIGYVDKDQYLYYCGRKDDVINVAGEKVMPEEVEFCAKRSRGVIDAAAVPMQDDLLGETVKLYIVIDKNKFRQENLESFLRKKLESYKIPKVFEEIEAIPHTDNGKVMRRKLK